MATFDLVTECISKSDRSRHSLKWSKVQRQLEVTFVVNSVFCVGSNAFHILIYARRYGMSLDL